jgi:hypothetical protein
LPKTLEQDLRAHYQPPRKLTRQLLTLLRNLKRPRQNTA